MHESTPIAQDKAKLTLQTPDFNKAKVAIIMRSKNSAWVIANTLAALASQEHQHYDLILVDSGSTDGTLEIASFYDCQLIQIEPEDYYPGKVLNQAIEQTQADIVVFLNSDAVLLRDDSLSNLLDAFDDPDTVAAFGRQIPRPEAHLWVRRDYATSFPASNKAPSWITLSLPFAAIRRQYWQQHPFYLDAWASEDTEWGHWARTNEYKLAYVPKALVMHSHNYSLKQLYGRRFVEGEADAFIYHKSNKLIQAIASFSKGLLRDCYHHIISRDIAGLIATPCRLFVYHWAYYIGLRWGNTRVRQQIKNNQAGQRAVLSRYQ
ncbi:glycosyltransferase family 2 protein [Shewanella violacea]|uniref:Glycosyl transferase, group 2 family protein n=1 Tax=Shewanella violacea (strain JCM 10179 / CIP 106290 / LMG 19151 / DSS12) TaxID=637905 RepID=D4ZIN6_SHEVD|nr:glycosyltransferase [Shewanella violacea]BAJ01535.1 glycosyl transferase, group 2 family protein [Shewanella violacea DSS12]